jgi:hypothetical protein
VPRIACLHTAESNIAIFDAALRELALGAVALRHHLRADLLAAAERAGGLTAAVADETADVLGKMCSGADAVLLTCSTLGPAADAAANGASGPVLRVDAALARQAAKDGGKVVVLCAVTTTLEPTRLLFEDAARATGAEIVVRLVPGAWDLFKAGDRDGYLALIAQAADDAFGEGARQVALAQASMAPAASLTSSARRPLSSPTAGLAAVIALLGADRP